MLGKWNGPRRRGRQKMRWLGGIYEATLAKMNIEFINFF